MYNIPRVIAKVFTFYSAYIQSSVSLRNKIRVAATSVASDISRCESHCATPGIVVFVKYQYYRVTLNLRGAVVVVFLFVDVVDQQLRDSSGAQ